MNTNSIYYHSNLSKYFASKPLYLDEPSQKKPNTRKLVEQPWQQTKGKMWDEVTDTLCNLDFIQAKACAKMTYELVNDFNEVLEIIPDNQETIIEDKARQARMDKYTHDLIACAKGEITTDELEIPESITPWTKEQTDSEIERIKTCPTKADLLKDFLNFLGNESNNLQNYAREFAHFTHQQAWNYAAEGPVGKAAEKLTSLATKFLLRRLLGTRLPWNPLPMSLQTLKGHIYTVNAVAITPDGKHAISGSYDNTCILWDLKTGDGIKTLEGHTEGIPEFTTRDNLEISLKLKGRTEGVHAVSITPDGKFAISGSGDKTCILWNLITGDAIRTLKGHTKSVHAVSITPDGKHAISGSTDNTCILWDMKTGDAIKTLMGHTEGVYAVSITPDGKYAISGSEDKNCILWNMKTGDAMKTLKGHTVAVYAVSITPDGKFAISGSGDKTCILWNLITGDAIKTLKGHSKGVHATSLTPDGKHAISSSRDNTCILWDLITGDAIKTLKGHTDFVDVVSITPDAKFAISGSGDKTCILWDLITGDAIKIRRRHTDFVHAVPITPDGKYAISGSRDNTCILWNMKTGDATKTLKGHTSEVRTISITPDGKHAISGSADNTCILWDMKTGDVIKKLKGHNDVINAVSITPDGKYALSASSDKTCILWDLITGDAIKTLKGHTSDVKAVSITPDGKHAISISGFYDNICILWDLITGDAIKILKEHNYAVYAVAISPDGKHAISSSRDKTCILWDMKTGDAIKTLKMHINNVYVVSITPDGKHAISGSEDNTCILWDLKTGDAIKALWGHNDAVNAVVITPDGKHAISGSEDKTCILWNLLNGKQMARFFTNSSISTISLYSEGIVLGCYSGEVVILNVEKELLCQSLAITTIRQIWDFEFQKYQPLSADCPLCGHRFAPPTSVLATIEKITKKAGLKSEQSPCLELPNEAWEEPGLLDICPKCGEGLKFNPFIAERYLSTRDKLKQEFCIKYEEAEKAFKDKNWDEAYNLYLKLVQQGQFDINYMRYNMAICKINGLFTNDPEIVSFINVLIKILQDKGAGDKAQLIADKLKERLETIKQEELLKKKSEAPWWKKMF